MQNLIDRRSITPGAIYGVGKNFPEHAKEMQQLEEVTPDTRQTEDAEPIIFMKPPTALETEGIIAIPQFHGHPLSANMHYEAELVLLVSKTTDGCSIQEAPHCIGGYGAGLDMTLRDVQLAAKKTGNPWLKSKGFRKSALISDFIPFNGDHFPDNLQISLEMNGSAVQQGSVSEMLHTPAMLIHYLSYLYGLRKGDLIFTGTPSGVGQVAPGDRLKVTLSQPENGSRERGKELTVLYAQVI